MKKKAFKTSNEQANDFSLNSSLQDYITGLLVEPNPVSTKVKRFNPKENNAELYFSNKNPKSNIHVIPSKNEQVSEEKTNQQKNYLEPDPRLKKVSKLLEKISITGLIQGDEKKSLDETNTDTKVEELKPSENTQKQVKNLTTEVDDKEDNPSSQMEEMIQQETIQNTTETSFSHRDNQPLRDSLDENFQTLIFDVNHLPLAVPLVKLGGIVNLGEKALTPLVGTPDWFLGLLPNERGNLMVVDTQKFLMPERPVKDERSYDYLIVLDNSQWALACHNVGDANNLQASDVRWSSKSSNRPWFAGMVVETMSALIEVDSLINLLAEQIVD